MIVLAATHILSMFQAALLAAGSMLIFGALDINDARKNIDLPVLLVIASALGIGNAMEVTGAAQTIAREFMQLAGDSPLLTVAATYLITWVLTEMITNNAAAVLVFPIAISMAASLGVSYIPFVMTIIVAASASFSTPIGYQTNLMVYGPGGYKFTDFAKVGLPLNLIVFAITVFLVPQVWGF
jgi:di/tricarboxylate transporter